MSDKELSCRHCPRKRYFCYIGCPELKEQQFENARKRMMDKYGDDEENLKAYHVKMAIESTIVLCFLTVSVVCIIYTIGELL